MKLRDDILVTAGLDGTVGMFDITNEGGVDIRFLMQVGIILKKLRFYHKAQAFSAG